MGWTYDTLKAALQDWTEDDNPEFVGQIDRIIALGEAKVARDLDFGILDVTDHGSFEVNQALVAKPDGYLSMRSLFVEDYNCASVYLEPRSYEFVMDINRDPLALGVPRYWCELNESQWMVAPRPEACFAWAARYIQRPAGLSADNPSTWVAANLPDALLYACLLHAEEYLKADERIAVWRERYNTEVIPAARHELRGLRRADYSPQHRVEG